jgi:hypothetical protein
MDDDISARMRYFIDKYGEDIIYRTTIYDVESNFYFLLHTTTSEEPLKIGWFPSTLKIGELLKQVKDSYPERKNDMIQIRYNNVNRGEKTQHIIKESNALWTSAEPILIVFLIHECYVHKQKEQFLSLEISFIQGRALIFQIFTKNEVQEREKNLVKKITDKMKHFKGDTFNKLEIIYMTEYQHYSHSETDNLYIIADESFMETICEKEIDNARNILLWVDSKNPKALEYQKQLGNKKVSGIHKNIELIMSIKNIDFS